MGVHHVKIPRHLIAIDSAADGIRTAREHGTMGKGLSKKKKGGGKAAPAPAQKSQPKPAPKKTADERRNEELADACDGFTTGQVASLFAHFSNLAAASPEVGTRRISRAQFEGALAEQGIDFKSNAFAERMFVAFDQ